MLRGPSFAYLLELIGVLTPEAEPRSVDFDPGGVQFLVVG